MDPRDWRDRFSSVTPWLLESPELRAAQRRSKSSSLQVEIGARDAHGGDGEPAEAVWRSVVESAIRRVLMLLILVVR